MARAGALARPSAVHRIRITLRNWEPKIWRSVAVPSDFTLGDLHHTIQCAMGWDGSHMHEFRIGKSIYVDMRMPVGEDDLDEEQVTLAQALPRARRKARYTYDFGDNWELDVQVEAVEPPDPKQRYPVVLAGEKAAPPEDCGGVWGYASLLEALDDPDHPAYEEMMEWLGEPLDPDVFDLNEANKQLQQAIKYIWSR